jgi:excalibur calcium-binding domain-containing protein
MRDSDLEAPRSRSFRVVEGGVKQRASGPKKRRYGPRLRRDHLRFAVMAGAAAGLLGFVLWQSKWPMLTTLRHLGAYPNCATARVFSLTPAHQGEPGYWPHLDADDDGIACEPWPR